MRSLVATLEGSMGSVYKGRFKVATIENIIVSVNRNLEEVLAPDGVSAYYDTYWEWIGEMNVAETSAIKDNGAEYRIRFDAEYDGKMTTYSGKVLMVRRTDEGRLQFVGNDALSGFKVW